MATPATEARETTPQSGYAPVNDLRMYYQIDGSGGVLVVLLHGAYMKDGLMEFLLSGLANTRQVIAVDLKGHGRTAKARNRLKPRSHQVSPACPLAGTVRN
jgi:pimeloyl-ACP methyl ester carboxylesterase